MSDQSALSIRKAYRPELTVLVVEDHALFSREIKHALPHHNVLFARTLEDARIRYDESLPDITFLDIDLPDGNGFDLIDFIRSREPEAYIIILTGSKLKEDIDTSRKKGVQGYIIKPFTRAKIEQHIEDYCQKREKGIKSMLAETERHRQQAIKEDGQE